MKVSYIKDSTELNETFIFKNNFKNDRLSLIGHSDSDRFISIISRMNKR